MLTVRFTSRGSPGQHTGHQPAMHFSTILVAACLLLVPVTANPVPGPAWRNPCVDGHSLSRDHRAQLPTLVGTIQRDSAEMNLTAERLLTFTRARISADHVESYLSYFPFETFPRGYIAEGGNELSVGLLSDFYRNVSRVAMYLEKMIENERFCPTAGNGGGLEVLTDMRSPVYLLLCHLQQALNIAGVPTMSYEDADSVLSETIQNVRTTCHDNDIYRKIGDFLLSRAVVGYSRQVLRQFSAIVNNSPASLSRLVS